MNTTALERREALMERYKFFLEDVWLRVNYKEKIEKTKLIKKHKVFSGIFSVLVRQNLISIIKEEPLLYQTNYKRFPEPTSLIKLIEGVDQERRKSKKSFGRREKAIDKILNFLKEFFTFNSEEAYLQYNEVLELIKDHHITRAVITVLTKKEIIRRTSAGYYIPMYNKENLTRNFAENILDYVNEYATSYKNKSKNNISSHLSSKSESRKIESRKIESKKEGDGIVKKRSLLKEVEKMIQTTIKQELSTIKKKGEVVQSLKEEYNITIPIKDQDRLKKIIIIEFE